MTDLMNINAPLDMASMPAETQKNLQNLQVQVQTLEMCRQLGQYYSRTAMVPKQYQGKQEDSAVAIQWGMEIGLQPLQALQNIACINGSPSLWGDAVIALVKGSGVCEYIHTDWDDATSTATVTTRRKGEQQEESRSYSLEDAKKAGLAGRQTYQQHAKRMIQARARSHVLRDVYADILKGFQIREVLEEDQKVMEKDITPKSNALAAIAAVKAEPEPVPQTPESTPKKAEKPVNSKAKAKSPKATKGRSFAELESAMRAVTTIADLDLIGKEIGESDLKEDFKDELRDIFMSRKAELA